MTSTSHVYYGTLVHSLSLKELQVIDQGVLIVKDGLITHVEQDVKDVDALLKSIQLDAYEVIKVLRTKQMIC
jgi:guanine deaminase